MKIGYIILLALGGYAAIQFWKNQSAKEASYKNRAELRPGVAAFPSVAVTHRLQQTQAYVCGNNCSSLCGPYSPAFGPGENQPASGTEWLA